MAIAVLLKHQISGNNPMAISWWMDKQNVLQPYNGIWFGNKRKWSIDTCYNINGPFKYFTKSKKTVTEDHILYHSTYMKYLE